MPSRARRRHIKNKQCVPRRPSWLERSADVAPRPLRDHVGHSTSRLMSAWPLIAPVAALVGELRRTSRSLMGLLCRGFQTSCPAPRPPYKPAETRRTSRAFPDRHSPGESAATSVVDAGS